MALDRDGTLSVLNDLIETCEDGIKGFREAADAVESREARAVFVKRIELIQRSEAELKAEVRRLGGDPEQRGSVSGALHRGWINLKSAITGRDDDAIIAECERGEDVAVKNYKAALEKELPAGIRAIVAQQYEGTEQNRDKVRALRTSAGGASATRSRDPGERGAPPPA